MGSRFWALVGATFLGFLGIGTVLPRLAPHVRHDLGGSDQTVGFVIGVFSFVALASRFISAPLADRKGRKTAVLAGLAACAASGGVYLLPLGIAGAYLGRMLQGFGEACLYTGAAVWAVEVAGIHRSAEALGYLSSGIWGGISAGPVVGQWIGSFEGGAVAQVVAATCAGLLLLRVREDYTPILHNGTRQWLPPWLVFPGLAVGFTNIHYPVITGFLVLHLARYGNSGPMAFSAYALLILLSRFFLGGLPDRTAPAKTFFTGLASMTVGLLVLATGPSPVFAVGATALLGFGFSFPWSSIAATVLRRIPGSQRGSAMGALSAFCDLFVGFGSFLAGGVAHHFGYPATFLVATASLAAAAVAGWFVFTSQSVSAEADVEEVEEEEPVLIGG